MRLTAILLLVAFLHVSGKTAGQTVTLSLKNAPIQKVFREIIRQTHVSILYDEKLFAGASPVTIDVHNATVDEVLKQCLQNQPVQFRIEQNTIRIEKDSSLSNQPAASPNITAIPSSADIHGRVTDSLGNPLAGESVTVKGSRKGTQTNAKGEFDLKNVNENAILVISFTGYLKSELKVSGNSSFAIVLIRSNSPLDQVQVIAYGTTTQRLNTGDVTTVTSKEIQEQPVSNPLAALDGRVPGLYIQQTSGVPGSNFVVRLRGQNSIANGNNPLYIVDGVPFTSTQVTTEGLGFPSGTSPLNYINPSDIENISVLKDADATAIYGSRGANGVILITTKKGKSGKTKADFNFYQGIGNVTHMMDLLNTPQYLQMRNGAFANDGATPGSADYDVNGAWDSTRYTNWQKTLIGGTAHYTDAQASISGGGPNTQFLFGAGYHNESTVFPGNKGDQKGSVHFNLNHTSLDQKFFLNFYANYVLDNNLVAYDYTGQALTLAPDAPALYKTDGTLNWQNATWTNPLSYQQLTNKANTKNLISNAVLGYTIIPGLQIKASFGYSSITQQEENLTPISSYDPLYVAIAPQYFLGQSTFVNNNVDTWIIEPQATYHKSLAIGNFNFLVGGTFQQTINSGTSVTGKDITNDALIEDVQAAPVVVASNSYSDYRYEAIFARINYDWQEKYLINITARRDGSSRFGPGKQFGNFGALGVAWIFTKEGFISNSLKFLSFGKIRASYGLTGNDQTGDYQYLNTYSATNYPYQGISGLFPTSLFNPNFGWETNKKLEAGIELGFINNRILFVTNLYQNRSSNQLVGYALPPTAGFSSVVANLPATIQNSGVEFNLNTINIQTKNFSWSTNINLSIPRNKLLAYPNLEGSSYANSYVVGKSLYAKQLFHYLGVNDTSGVYQFASKAGPTFSPSYPQDLQVNKEVSQSYFGGFLNSFQYKGWRLDILFQFVKQTAYNYITTFNLPGVLANQPTDILNNWKQPGDIASVQQYTQNYGSDAATAYFNSQGSDKSIGDASFVRLKNLAVSYQIPDRTLEKIHIQYARIYIQCQNLFTFTKYLGPDPEQANNLQTLPSLRVLSAGIQFTL